LLNQYDYYILPSFYEGMPKTLLEAMACGLVCIGTDVTGINEIINDGANGYLAKSCNAKDILNVIEHAFNNDCINDELKIHARETIYNQYSLDEISKKEVSLFSRLV